MFRLSFVLLAILLLSACSVPNTQPQMSAAENPEIGTPLAQESTSSVGDQAVEVDQVVVERESSSLSNQIDQLMGRLTLVQEQVINQRALSQQQLELTQAILQRVQLLTNTALIDETKPQGEPANGMQSDQLDAALNQLLQVANEMQVNASNTSVGGAWEVASAVTSKGWILIRYRKDTGESWIAENASWTLLKDEPTPTLGDYSVQIERRDDDSKGYVSVRLNSSTGNTWWLNDRTWQAY